MILIWLIVGGEVSFSLGIGLAAVWALERSCIERGVKGC